MRCYENILHSKDIWYGYDLALHNRAPHHPALHNQALHSRAL
jgi:hypothetical protein